VLPDHSTERGSVAAVGDTAALEASTEAHREAAQHLVLARSRTKTKGAMKKHVRYRTKSYKLGVALDCSLKCLGCDAGLGAFMVPKEHLDKGTGAATWPSLTITSDKGPDCLALRNYIVNKMAGCNIDWQFDPCHGAHHAISHALVYSGLKVHSFLMVFAYNTGIGPWGDGSCREAVLKSMADTKTAYQTSQSDPCFQAALPLWLDACDGEWSTAVEQAAYEDIHSESVWSQSDPRLTNSKFFGYTTRFLA